METESAVDGPADLRALTRMRVKEAMQEMADIRPTTAYLYFLLEPDSDTIRYVGQCVNPDSRFRAHASGAGSPQVSEWVRSLRARGTLPRMQIVARLQTFDREHVMRPLSVGWITNKAERALIRAISSGAWYANDPYLASLLNIQAVPQNFLPNGLDAAKDRI